MYEEIRNEILKKVEEYGYKSATFRLALVKEESFWKIVVANIILDISEPKKDETFLDEESFALEDIHVTITEFKKFIDYLGHAYIGDISPDGKATISKEVQFAVGKYDLCFVGNFPGNTIDFFGRKDGIDHYGMNKPFYHIWYAVHQSVSPKKRPNLDLTSAEVPFRNISEAINYFWGTKYEEHSLAHHCNIYMPTFEASISSFNINDHEVVLEFDIDPKRVKIEDLSFGIIADRDSKSYRANHKIKTNIEKVSLEFEPHSVNIYLNHQGKRIDVYNYYNYKQPRIPLVNRTSESPFFENDENELRLLDVDIISNLPPQIQNLLVEGEKAFNSNLHRATAIMFRSAIEEGITLLLKQIRKEEELYNNKMEIGLERKIKLICDYMPTFKQTKEDMKMIKWFGDKAVHEANMPINEQDIVNILEPKIRLILAKFAEEIDKK